MNEKIDFLVVGGGAAGFFAAINYALRLKRLGLKKQRIVILEQSGQVLKKVKISGGGRCNITHSCFDPHQLVQFYPRGKKELLAPFFQFSPTDTIGWFLEQGVKLKTEADGRIFPVSDSSLTIIDCFLNLTKSLDIEIISHQTVQSFHPIEKNDYLWQVQTNHHQFVAKKLLLASGGNSTTITKQLKSLGLSISEPIASLFTFNTKDKRLQSLSGISVENALIKVVCEKTKSMQKTSQSGALLITHRGLSGPAILKISALEAKLLHSLDYKFSIEIDWCHSIEIEQMQAQFNQTKKQSPNKTIMQSNLFGIPKRLWMALVAHSSILVETTWANVNKKQLQSLIAELKKSTFFITGKSANKEEFVTCGGVDLKEINFKDFSVKKYNQLYIVGELLNIDGLTGGFNFQAAWTGAYLAAYASL